MILRDIIHWGGVLKKKLEYEVVRRGYQITLEVLRQKKSFLNGSHASFHFDRS
jgi:hypothetical protein